MKNDLDVLIVHPNASGKVYQSLSKDFSAIEPPIWAGMIANYLKLKGLTVDLLDCEAYRLSVPEAVAQIKSKSPRIVCTVVYGQQPSASTQNMVGSMLLNDALKDSNFVRAYIGAHPSALPERTIQDDPEVVVCKGEGVKTLEVLARLSTPSDRTEYAKIPGLAYMENGQVKVNTSVPIIQNLDSELPGVDWSLFDLSRYRTSNWHSWTNSAQTQPFASIYTSLGCPFKCTFCMINSPFNEGNIKNNTFRYWSPEHIIKQFDYFAANGVTNVKIADEMFVYRPDHFMKLCDLIIKRGHKFNIWAYARIDTVREQYLKTLKQAGVNWLGLGIESASKEVRFEVTKGKFQDTNIQDIVKKIQANGICTTGNYIFGLPTDTYESMRATLNLAISLKTEYVNFYSAMAYPGSQLHREFSKSNPQILPEYPGNPGWIGYSQHSYECFPLPTQHLKNWEVLKFRDAAFLEYFNNTECVDTAAKTLGAVYKTEITRMLAATNNTALPRKIVELNS